jgi:hypothetical protein
VRATPPSLHGLPRAEEVLPSSAFTILGFGLEDPQFDWNTAGSWLIKEDFEFG